MTATLARIHLLRCLHVNLKKNTQTYMTLFIPAGAFKRTTPPLGQQPELGKPAGVQFVYHALCQMS